MDSEDTRKGIHILNGLWVLILPFFPRIFAIFIVLLALVFVFILARPNSPYGSFFRHSFNSMARKEDIEKGYLVGPSIYVLMILILILFVDYRIAGAVFAILAFGDGFATIFGRKFGKHKIYNNKTFEGSFAFFLFALLSSISIFLLINYVNTDPSDAGLALISFLMLPDMLNISLSLLILIFTMVTIMLTFIELFIGDYINDNFMIPISGSILLYICFNLLLVFHLNV